MLDDFVLDDFVLDDFVLDDFVLEDFVLDPLLGGVDVDDGVVDLDADGDALLVLVLVVDDGFGVRVGFGGCVGCVEADAVLNDDGEPDEVELGD